LSRKHSDKSFIHQVAMQVVDHLIDENGICDHTYKAIAAMFGTTEPTIQMVRIHLESCPDSRGHMLPYRAKGPLVLTDPDKNETTLEDLKAQRAAPVLAAFSSMLRMLKRMDARNVTALDALGTEARAIGDNDLADALEQAALDVRTTGDIHPMTRLRLQQLGVLS
jgi:hypothetical protein